MGSVKEEREGGLHKYYQMPNEVALQNTFSHSFWLTSRATNKLSQFLGISPAVPFHRLFFVSTTRHQTAGDRSSPAFVLSVALKPLSSFFSPDHSAVPVAHKMLLHLCCSFVCLHTQLWFRNGAPIKTSPNHALRLYSRMERRIGGTRGKDHGLG